jgi:hypothetical protein
MHPTHPKIVNVVIKSLHLLLLFFFFTLVVLPLGSTSEGSVKDVRKETDDTYVFLYQVALHSI